VIKNVSIRSFKRFSHLDVNLGALTVLTGLNGSGKSSVLQAILLAHQCSLSRGATVPLVAESWLDLGHASDVLHASAESSRISVQIVTAASVVEDWVFDAGSPGSEDTPYLEVVSQPANPTAPIGVVGPSFSYLSAERLGPRTSHRTTAAHPDALTVGPDGALVAYVLATASRKEVDALRRHPDAGLITTLGAQVEAWLTQLVGATQLEAALVPHTNMATLRIRTPGRLAEWMLPTNTGFGLSYSLPVVVAGLLAPVDGLLLVDSPEAHLHPAAQSAMGVFLTTVAAAGVQVVIETHSDHILNGVRKAVAVRHLIDNNQVHIAYFGESAEPTNLALSASGGVSAWPNGFFDQAETDLRELARARVQ
jgi:predicted ATPase